MTVREESQSTPSEASQPTATQQASAPSHGLRGFFHRRRPVDDLAPMTGPSPMLSDTFAGQESRSVGSDEEPSARVLMGRAGLDFWSIWIFAYAMTMLFALYSAAISTPGDVPELWVVATVAFTWTTMSWPTRTVLPPFSWHLVLTLSALGTIGAAAAVTLHGSPLDIVRSAIGIPLQGLITCSAAMFVRRFISRPAPPPLDGASAWRQNWSSIWAPDRPLDFLPIAVGAVVSGFASLLLGSVPGMDVRTLDGMEIIQWMSHVIVVTIVGGAAVLIIFATWQPADLDQPWVQIIAIWLASLCLLLWVHETGAVTMAWLQVIPTIFIALTCRVWSTAIFGLLLSLFSVMLSPRLNEIEANPGPIPLATVMDLMVATLILLSITLAFLERHRDRLVHDVGDAQAMTQRHLTTMMTVFEGMKEGIVVVGPDHNIRFNNSSAVELLGRPVLTERNDDWLAHFSVTALDGSALRDADLLKARNRTVQIHVNGERRVLAQRLIALGDHADDGVMVVFSDVTEQHERMGELSGFAGVVAHDLRAPLTSLEGWLELAIDSLEHDEPEEAAGLLERARTSNHRMRQVIQDWLNYTVENQGALTLTEFPLEPVVRSVMSGLNEQGPHRFTLEVSDTVRADHGLVRQVLANIMGNASKFTRAGETPRIAVTSHLLDDGWIQVDVEDRGIGVPSGQEEAIFGEYQRGSGEATKVEGYGLGLSMCRRVVERHEGQIWARSTGTGTVISFTLPGPGVELAPAR